MKLNWMFFCYMLWSLCGADTPSETLYLTWQQDPTTTMTFQWLSDPEDNRSQISYQKADEEKWVVGEGKILLFPYTSYFLHRVELTGLTPDTLYKFRLKDGERTYLFRTMPSDLKNPVRFVVGGDMYHDDIEFMNGTSEQAALTEPDFALLGGDIAYSVTGRLTSKQKPERWVEWVKAWHHSMVTPEGRMIPVVAAIGNHDLIGQYNQTPAEARIFSALFPIPGNQIYNVLDFNSYLSLFMLDSGHANPIGGAQANWLAETLEKRANQRYKFAIYHVPAYPSVRSFNTHQSILIRRYWTSLFESGGIQVAFEHHDHAYKRTAPLLQNKIDPKGVVYLGDGGWGVENPRKMQGFIKPFYLEKAIPMRHFLVVDLNEKALKVSAVTDKGIVFDEYSNLQEEKDSETEGTKGLKGP